MGAIRLRNIDNIKNLLEVQSLWTVLLSLSTNRHTSIVFGLIAPNTPHSINRAIDTIRLVSAKISIFAADLRDKKRLGRGTQVVRKGLILDNA